MINFINNLNIYELRVWLVLDNLGMNSEDEVPSTHSQSVN